MDSILTTSWLSKKYGSACALKDVNLQLPRGKIIGLLGPNGSGKTTFLKLLAGLLTPTSGRMEICGKAPFVILDGAHNADGIRQLANSIHTYFKDQKVTLILGVLGDKEYEKMAEHILPHADTVILTEPHSERKLHVFSLARSISNHEGMIYTEKEIENAMEKALSLTPADGVILCCGSLYMIGAMRTYIKSKN